MMGNNIIPYLQYQYPQQNSRPQYYENQFNNNFGLKGRQVSSIDEVKAMTIDFDGTIFYFPDLANNKIYIKQVNPMNGIAQMQVYELKEQPVPSTPPQNNSNYITREEFEKAIAELRKISSTPIVNATEAEAQKSAPVDNKNGFVANF